MKNLQPILKKKSGLLICHLNTWPNKKPNLKKRKRSKKSLARKKKRKKRHRTRNKTMMRTPIPVMKKMIHKLHLRTLTRRPNPGQPNRPRRLPRRVRPRKTDNYLLTNKQY